MNTSGPLFHHTGNVRPVGGRMAKIVNYAALLFATAMFVVLSPSLAGSAYAYLGDGHHTYITATVLTNPNLVCGNHICASGEMPQHLPVVTPVKGIK